jgi:hypothetical protein
MIGFPLEIAQQKMPEVPHGECGTATYFHYTIRRYITKRGCAIPVTAANQQPKSFPDIRLILNARSDFLHALSILTNSA